MICVYIQYCFLSPQLATQKIPKMYLHLCVGDRLWALAGWQIFEVCFGFCRGGTWDEIGYLGHGYRRNIMISDCMLVISPIDRAAIPRRQAVHQCRWCETAHQIAEGSSESATSCETGCRADCCPAHITKIHRTIWVGCFPVWSFEFGLVVKSNAVLWRIVASTLHGFLFRVTFSGFWFFWVLIIAVVTFLIIP